MIFERKVFYDRKEVKKLQFQLKLKKKQFESKKRKAKEFKIALRKEKLEKLSSTQGRTEDALALAGEEGRGKLRKASGSC